MNLIKQMTAVGLALAFLATPVAAFADTSYQLPVQMQKADGSGQVSVGNGALKQIAEVTVKDNGHTDYTVYVRPIQMQGLTGHLTKLFIYQGKDKVEAREVAHSGEYNKALSFSREKARESSIKGAVWVDAMDELAGGGAGAGEQDAILQFDWQKAKEVAKTSSASGKVQPVGTDPIQVFVKGQKLSFDSQPVIQNSRTLVPLRAIFEALGATVQWDNASRTVTAQKDGHKIGLTIGKSQATVDGQTKTLDVPASIQNGRTLVPLRFIGEAFDNQVNYEKVDGIAVIDIR